MIKPKKSLGQHFLHDKNIAKKIVDILNDAETIIEIGPGTGALSELLYKKYKNKILFIEIDIKSIEYLNHKLNIPQEQLLHIDFLKFNFENLLSPINVIGNFPYNISSQIFFKLLEHKEKINQIVCMVQKEVAQRIASTHGNKNYGILSVLLQTYFHVRYHFQVNENVFIPPPKVKSAVIELIKKKNNELPLNEEFFIKIVKTAFNQRRKILLNSLNKLVDKNSIPPEFSNKRPEMLSINEFIKLANSLTQ
jgi:16S rRNA (adenine1518-N6/adenine1519-N6)-dimethyltransferase